MPGVFPPQEWEGLALVDGALVNPCPISPARAMGGRLVIAVSLHSDIEGAHAADPDQPELPLPVSMEAAGPFSVYGKWLRPDRIILEHIFGDGSKPTVSSVMIGALNILLDRVTRARLAGDPPDVLIAPKVGAIGLIDFHRAEELIRLGRQAADEAMPRIERAIERLR
jgi:NTE family protein